MKLVIISVPNNVSIEEIKEAAVAFGDALEMPTVKVNVLNEADIEVRSSSEIVNPIIDKIIQKCAHPNNLIAVANFWRSVSTGEIDKNMLLQLSAHRTATKAYLKQKKSDCFFALFDDALKRM